MKNYPNFNKSHVFKSLYGKELTQRHKDAKFLYDSYSFYLWIIEFKKILNLKFYYAPSSFVPLCLCVKKFQFDKIDFPG